MRNSAMLPTLLAFLLWSPVVVSAQEADEQKAEQKDDDLTARRNQLMGDRMGTVTVRGETEEFPTRFAPKPIFRYTDPARGYVAAAIWSLGESGRPKAIITTELHRSYYGSPRIVYEYLALTPEKFQVAGRDIRWQPSGTALEFQAVPEAPAPEGSPQKRLLQLRAIARRFGGSEVVGKDKCELRLLPQPILRYVPSATERADGAAFLLTFGVNPEVVLFVESDGQAWNYAAGRLTGAGEVVLTIDGNEAWKGDRVRYGSSSPYTASNAPADIPGVAADGSEIAE